MVSGFLTSPCDHCRMSSAVARPIRRSSKKLTSSTYISPWGRSGSRSCWTRPTGGRRAACSASPWLSHLFNAARLAPRQVDAELLRGAEDILVGIAHLDGGAVAGKHLDVEAERLHLLDEHLEGLGNARLRYVLAFDYRLVDLHPAEDVVGLDRKQLLQRIGGAVRLKRPDLHLTEPLAAELRLTAKRLLRDHRVRARRPSVDLVIDQVQQFEDVDEADRDRVPERFAGPAVEQTCLTACADELLAVAVWHRGAEQTGDLLLVRSVEHRRGQLGARLRLGSPDLVQPLLPRAVAGDLPPGLRHPPEMHLEHLADVHPAGHAEWVEHNVHRRAILKERHVLNRQDLGDHTLVSVPPRELVPIGDLPLLRHVHPDELVHAGRQLIAVFPGEDPDDDDLPLLAVRHLERGVPHLAGLLTEDGPQ